MNIKFIKYMKANKIQQYICDVIHSQADFWQHSNDITSPTHLSDIEEECSAQLCDLISDDDREEFENKLKDLYWFIRKIRLVMKANEAPEKIYLQDSMSTDTIGDLWPEWFDAEVSNNSIEYIRTDVFIEKAWEWVEDNILSINQQDKSRLYFEQFKNYIKGE